MKLEHIKTMGDAQHFVQETINDFDAGDITKEETMEKLGQYTKKIMSLFWISAKQKIKKNPRLLLDVPVDKNDKTIN